jgi:hypothetical protein
MLHMHAAGPTAQSAVLLSLSALHGANIFQLQRDEAYLAELLHYIQQFTVQFVACGVSPPPNFFIKEQRYRAFIARTRQLADAAPVIAHLSSDMVQRGDMSESPFLDTP